MSTVRLRCHGVPLSPPPLSAPVTSAAAVADDDALTLAAKAKTRRLLKITKRLRTKWLKYSALSKNISLKLLLRHATPTPLSTASLFPHTTFYCVTSY